MKRTEKEGFVEDFRERLQESPAIFLTDFTGLDVKSMTVLRAELKKDGARVEELLPLMLIAKHIERIADLATNIAEDVIYMSEGRIIRHNKDKE